MDAPPDEHQLATCWECGYSLRGLITPRCPECGRPFNPADKTTMNMGTQVGWFKRWLMRPPGWPLHLLTAAAVIMSLWACAEPMRRGALAFLLSDLIVHFNRSWYWERFSTGILQPGFAEVRFFIAVAVWLLISITWTARRIARGMTVRRISSQKPAPFAYWRWWLVTPVIFGLTILVCRSNFPVWAGFWLSKPWLEQSLKDAQANAAALNFRHVYLPSRWWGIYPPRPKSDPFRADVSRGETLLYFNRGGGFVYREDCQPPTVSSDPFSYEGGSGAPSIRHLTGPWYVLEYGQPGGD